MAEGIERFMHAISAQESGHNYNAVGPYTGSTYGRARGKYQVMETIWPGWAKEAGIPGADWRDPAAQERVARHKMSQYYQRFGSWDLVAVAWFAGPARAAKAQREGIGAVGNLNDVLGTTVAGYVSKMNKTMGSVDPADIQTVSYGGADETLDEPAERPRTSEEVMASVMESISKAAQQNGGKVLNTEALLGGVR